MDAVLLLCLAVIGAEPDVVARGVAQNENFLVTAPTQESAKQILVAADAYRQWVAREWLDLEEAPRLPWTRIDVEFHDDVTDRARMLIIGETERRSYRIELCTQAKAAKHAPLRHEIVHLVLHTELGDQIPAWADEGAACIEDSPELIGTLRRTNAWYPKTGKWPKLSELLDRKRIRATDYEEYATAWSLCTYLSEQGNKQKILRFAMSGVADGWNTALSDHYRIGNVEELQKRWQTWVTASTDSKDSSNTASREARRNLNLK